MAREAHGPYYNGNFMGKRELGLILAFVVAGAGSLEPDYDSHNLLIRAHWQF